MSADIRPPVTKETLRRILDEQARLPRSDAELDAVHSLLVAILEDMRPLQSFARDSFEPATLFSAEESGDA